MTEVAFDVGLVLDQYDLLEGQIETADCRVAGLLDGELARRLQTSPGVGPAITATLIAEIGDIRRFSDFDQLLAFAGVHPSERSSGTKGANPETAWHMSKAGNSHLRAAAYRMAVVGVQHNPVIASHYARKRAAGTTKMNALGHCMRKALSLVWGVWRNGQDFDPDWGSRLEKTLWDLGRTEIASGLAFVWAPWPGSLLRPWWSCPRNRVNSSCRLGRR
jgi:transposase